MKHLLIILISILLLSSPVIGDNHKGETLYMWGKYPDYVWKGFGEKETHPKYEGDVEIGRMLHKLQLLRGYKTLHILDKFLFLHNSLQVQYNHSTSVKLMKI